jgi:hypothetical protein
MIKFFRHIRQQVIKENRVSRYVLYAIGEIVLVVIGILIALQLNEWKADRADRKMEQSHMENFHEDMRAQLEIIDAQIAHENQWILQADSALLYFSGELSLTQLEAIMYGHNSIGLRKTFVKSNAAFEELLNTGGLHLIRNPEMRKEMMLYHQQLDYTSSVINMNNGLIDDIFNTLSSSHVAIFSIDTKGELDTTITLTGQERYRIKQSLEYRIGLGQAALLYCNKQRNATIELMAKIDNLSVP